MEETTTQRCFFCQRESDSIVCDSDECQRYDRESTADFYTAKRKQAYEGLYAALTQCHKTCNNCFNRSLTHRWFYTFKLLICFGLNLTYRGKESYPHCHEIGSFNYRKLYAGWHCEWIRVGDGILTGWWWDIHEDGEWTM